VLQVEEVDVVVEIEVVVAEIVVGRFVAAAVEIVVEKFVAVEIVVERFVAVAVEIVVVQVVGDY
jgi:hypothetical protein